MTITKTAFQPDYAVPPGWILDEMLEARSLSYAEFARRCGHPAKLVRDIVAGRAPIEPDVAHQFEKVIGMDAEVWLNLESAYRNYITKDVKTHQISDPAVENLHENLNI